MTPNFPPPKFAGFSNAASTGFRCTVCGQFIGSLSSVTIIRPTPAGTATLYDGCFDCLERLLAAGRLSLASPATSTVPLDAIRLIRDLWHAVTAPITYDEIGALAQRVAPYEKVEGRP